MEIIFKKPIEVSKVPDKELGEFVDKIVKNDNEMIEEDTGYNGFTFSLVELNMLMNRLTTIKKDEDKRHRRPYDLSAKEKGNCTFNISVPQAVKDILGFLKGIDQELYLYSLNLFLGVKEDSINIYNKYTNKDRIKSGELRDSSLSTGGKKRDIFVLLDEYIDEKSSKKLSRFVEQDSCTIEEALKIMHEVSHSFDKSTHRQLLKLKGSDLKISYPEVTSLYLSETTAIFFETLFGEYLAENDPNYREAINRTIKTRLGTNLSSIERTRIISGLVRMKKEQGFVPDNFLGILSGSRNPNSLKEKYMKDPYIYESRKYALSQAFVPTMIKVYMEDTEKGNERIKRYLECVKNNDFDGAVASFGINLRDENSYNNMLINYRDYIRKYGYEKPKTIEER